jgi:hypothetical protein
MNTPLGGDFNARMGNQPITGCIGSEEKPSLNNGTNLIRFLNVE